MDLLEQPCRDTGLDLGRSTEKEFPFANLSRLFPGDVAVPSGREKSGLTLGDDSSIAEGDFFFESLERDGSHGSRGGAEGELFPAITALDAGDELDFHRPLTGLVEMEFIVGATFRMGDEYEILTLSAGKRFDRDIALEQPQACFRFRDTDGPRQLKGRRLAILGDFSNEIGGNHFDRLRGDSIAGERKDEISLALALKANRGISVVGEREETIELGRSGIHAVAILE